MIAVSHISNLLDVPFNRATYAYYFLAWKAVAICSVVIELWLAGVLHHNNNDNNSILHSNPTNRSGKNVDVLYYRSV